MNKNSIIQFEMWDDNSPLGPDLMLRKSLSVDELVKES